MPDTTNTNSEITVGPPDVGWTVTTLKAYADAAFAFVQRQFDQLRGHYNMRLEEIDRRYEARFQAQEKAISAALSSTQAAVSKAEIAYDKRFDGVNEFRETLADQQRTLMPRAESLALHAATQEKFEVSAANRLLMMPRAECVASLTALQEKYDSLQARIDRGEGRTGGLAAGGQILIAGVGLILTLLTIGGILFATLR